VAEHNGFKPKPLVDANLVTEYGGIEDMEQFRDEGAGQHDYTYVPGSSDARVARDGDLTRLHRGEIRAKEVRTLDHNCRWFRMVKGAGSDPDMMRAAHATNQGYRAATQKDIGQPWMTALPPGGRIAPDGTIKSSGGDLALYVIDKQGAAKIAMRKKIATEEAVDGMAFQAGGLGAVGGQVKGAAPTVDRKLGDPIK
jgi:hypothetical protein